METTGAEDQLTFFPLGNGGLPMTRYLRWIAVVLLAASALRAEAIPAFARKYGMSCTACHVAWPIFNQQGQSFRDNGYQFGLDKDDPVTLSQAYVPISLRTTAAYTFTRATNQPSDQGPITVQTGGVPLPPGVDILTAGTIAKDISFLLVVSGFGPDGTASVESAWARLDNLLGSGWLNFKIGKFELDEPASAHRGVALTTGYAVYGAHPLGSMVGFDMGENQVGIEIDGHDARSATRYSLSFTSVSGGEGLSGNGWSSPMVYGHVQQAFETGSSVLPWIRVGVLGGIGWWPTTFDTSGGMPIPGTGRDHKQLTRAGAEVSWLMGEPATPLFFTVAYQYGHEDAGLAVAGTLDPATGVDLSTVSNSFNGGFAELDWVPFAESSYNAIPWLFFARYDLVRYERGTGNVDGGTIGARRYLALGPRASAAIHLEYHYDQTKGAGAPDPVTTQPMDVVNQSVLAGIDFAF
jgi:hypothetical protein